MALSWPRPRVGGANVYLDFDVALETIRACVDETLKRAGLTDEARGRLFLGLGLAGVSSAAIARQVEAALDGLAEVRVANDAVTACLGAHAGQDGGLIIAGTGSAGLALIDGREIFVGGRGFVLGDDGSGARIGLESWRRALRAHDGLEDHTPFTRKLMAQFGDDPAAVIRWGLKARSSDYGAYAPAAFTAAAAGDPVALELGSRGRGFAGGARVRAWQRHGGASGGPCGRHGRCHQALPARLDVPKSCRPRNSMRSKGRSSWWAVRCRPSA